MSKGFDVYDTRLNDSHRGHIRPQRIILSGFLNSLSSAYGLECPIRRGGKDGRTVVSLPSDINRLSIYENYIEAFPQFRQAAQEFMNGRIPGSPLSFSFLRYWDQRHPTLQVSKLIPIFVIYSRNYVSICRFLGKQMKDKRYQGSSSQVIDVMSQRNTTTIQTVYYL